MNYFFFRIFYITCGRGSLQPLRGARGIDDLTIIELCSCGLYEIGYNNSFHNFGEDFFFFFIIFWEPEKRSFAPLLPSKGEEIYLVFIFNFLHLHKKKHANYTLQLIQINLEFDHTSLLEMYLIWFKYYLLRMIEFGNQLKCIYISHKALALTLTFNWAHPNEVDLLFLPCNILLAISESTWKKY